MSETSTLTIELPEALVDHAEGLLHEAGCLGLEVRDGETKPMPGQRVPPAGRVLLVAYFDGAEVAQQQAEELQNELPGARFDVEQIVEQDWSERWKDLIKAVSAGRLWVGPPWLRQDAPAGSVQVVIEPGMAFGTGDHATTHFCLEAIDRALAEHPGATVLDVGTGSAVLAIAARKLGAARVVGTDNDPIAVRVAQENALANHVEGLELSTDALEEVTGTFDVVVANILANTLTELAAPITAKVARGGLLVLAGILATQADDVLAAYLALGLTLRARVLRGEWAMLELGRSP